MSRRAPHSIFCGSLVALPTPFAADQIDFAAFGALIERQVDARSDGLVIGGSTGESTALTDRERVSLFEFAAGCVHGRVPVIAGIGSGHTRVATQLAVEAENVGADGLLVTVPAYSRPQQDGLKRHFASVARATTLPIALYNIPARTGADLAPETVAEIARAHDNVVAIKEASDSIERLRDLVALECVAVLCGDDRLIADAMEVGAAGVIGVVSNLVPERVAALVRSFSEEDGATTAPDVVETLAPLIRALGMETNPAPLKAALECMGLGNGDLRLPLVRVSADNLSSIRKALAIAGLAE